MVIVVIIILNVVRAVFQTQFQVVQDGLRRTDRGSGLFGNTEFGRLVMSPRIEVGQGGRRHGIITYVGWMDEVVKSTLDKHGRFLTLCAVDSAERIERAAMAKVEKFMVDWVLDWDEDEYYGLWLRSVAIMVGSNAR